MLKDSAKNIGYDDPLEIYLSRIESLISGDYKLSKRSLALLVLQEDKDIIALIQDNEKERAGEINSIVQEAKARYAHPLSYIISQRRQKEASRISNMVMSYAPAERFSARALLSKIMMNPFLGAPVLLAVLYYGLYKFVGSFG
jgi:ferrous iron transport protein B